MQDLKNLENKKNSKKDPEYNILEDDLLSFPPLEWKPIPMSYNELTCSLFNKRVYQPFMLFSLSKISEYSFGEDFYNLLLAVVVEEHTILSTSKYDYIPKSIDMEPISSFGLYNFCLDDIDLSKIKKE